MKFFTKILLLFYCIKGVGQPEIDWQKTIGGSSIDGLNSIAVVPVGGFILAGSSASNISGEKTDNSRGANDYWIIQLSDSGSILWQKTIGGSDGDGANEIKTTANGVVVAGTSSSNISGEKTENSRGFADYWIVTLDGDGDISWQKTIGGDNLDILNAVEIANNGNYILAGYSFSGISGEKSEVCRDIGIGGDYWVVSLSPAGTIDWQRTIGGNNRDELYRIRKTADGGYILGGQSSSGIGFEKSEACFGQFDYWIIKLDETGNIEWQKTLGGNESELFGDIIQSSDNGYLVTGSSTSGISGNKTEASKGQADWWIVKLDSFGNILWQKTIGGSDSEYYPSIAETADANYLITGDSESSISGDKTENSRGSSDFWIVKINQSGSIIWQKTIGGSLGDGANSIVATSDNSYLIGGNSVSGISGDKNEICRGESDFWLVKLTPDELSSEGFEKPLATIFPNPAEKNINIAFENPQSGTLTLIDTTGKMVQSKSFSGTMSYIIELNCESGFYFLTVETIEGKKQTFKICKR